MVQYLPEFLTIAGVHLLAVASPGPDFAIMLRQSVTFGRRAGVLTSVGIGVAILLHVAYCVLGLGFVISNSIVAFNVAKILGAIYLICIGMKAIRAKKATSFSSSCRSCSGQPSDWQSFSIGFMTNALNPKATLFFLSLFSVVISPSTPIAVQLGYGTWMVFATILWFSSLSLLFSGPKVRGWFQSCGHWFERVMGVLLIALGLKLALAEARQL